MSLKGEAHLNNIFEDFFFASDEHP